MTPKDACLEFFWKTLMRGAGDLPREVFAELLRLRVDPPGPDAPSRWRIRRDMHLSPFDIRLNTRTGKVMSWSCPLLQQNSARVLSEEQCLAAAQECARPPQDAVLDSAGYDARLGVEAFWASWRHLHEGMPVFDDHITVAVNGRTGHVFAFATKWHTPSLEPSLR